VDVTRDQQATADPNGDAPGRGARTVRDATFDVLRRLRLTTMFSNPGSTEVPFLAGMPGDLEFVLGLHEGAVVGMAAGFALGRGAPALVLLHSTPGFGNAVAALATARQNRAPLVVLVGQQDRRHLAQDPFLAGRLDALAGDYPVWTETPARAADVPGAIVRAYWEAETGRGPAVVIVPMDDWNAPAPEEWEVIGPRRLLRASGVADDVVNDLASLLHDAARVALVAGASADWPSLVALAERLACPVWAEPFGGAAGFPQDHPRFAGHVPARRARVREVLRGYDVVLVVGTGALRQYPYDDGPLFEAGTTVAVVTADPSEAHRSAADLAVLGDPGAVCSALASAVAPRVSPNGAPARRTPTPAPPAPEAGAPLTPAHVLSALAERLPRDAVVVEETPSSRPELHARLPIAEPGGFISAMGLLGFALPAAIGARLAQPERGVIAVVGDGASLYQIMSLWSAGEYGAGVVFLVLSNGGYAIMDRLAERTGAGAGPWPALDSIDICGLARAQGIEAIRITEHDDLLARFDDLIPSLAARETPLLVEVAVAQDARFDP
jgi:benzoylformate decarboxylase